MKKLEIVIRPDSLDRVKKALEKIGALGMTVTSVMGRGRQKGIPLQWRAGEFWVDLLPKVKIEMVVRDGDVDRIVNTIIQEARTGERGDGKIFVFPVEDAIRVSNGDTGESAI